MSFHYVQSTNHSISNYKEIYRKKIRREQNQHFFREIRTIRLKKYDEAEETRENNFQIHKQAKQVEQPPRQHPIKLKDGLGRHNNQNMEKKNKIEQILSIQDCITDQNKNQYIWKKAKGFYISNKIIGQGTYSKVYQGYNIQTKTKVAIKQIQNHQQNQIVCLQRFFSPFIIQMLQFWQQKNYTYIVFEYCENNLRQQLTQCTKQQGLKYFRQIIIGMNHLVEQNIIHRDLKFQNILIKDKVAKISDFGLAKSLGKKRVLESFKCGTPYTMAPQILFYVGMGKPIYTTKCDIWSLGILLHEILYGCHPFDYSTYRMAYKNRVKIEKKYPIYDYIIDKTLEFNEKDRICWTQLIQIVSEIEQQQSIQKRQKTKTEKISKLCEKNVSKIETKNIDKQKINLKVKLEQKPIPIDEILNSNSNINRLKQQINRCRKDRQKKFVIEDQQEFNASKFLKYQFLLLGGLYFTYYLLN